MLIFLDFSPEKDTEVYADNRTSTFKCCWSFVGEEALYGCRCRISK